MKLFFIAILCIFFSGGNLFGQTSHASISATITNPVGAEISGDINDMTLNKSSTQKFPAIDIQGKDNEKHISFLKIIGETFSHQVIIENIYTSKKETKENDGSLYEKDKRHLNVIVSFD